MKDLNLYQLNKCERCLLNVGEDNLTTKLIQIDKYAFEFRQFCKSCLA